MVLSAQGVKGGHMRVVAGLHCPNINCWVITKIEEPWFCLSCAAELPFADSSLNSTDNIMADGHAPIGRGSGYLNCQVLNACSIVNKRWDLQALLSMDSWDFTSKHQHDPPPCWLWSRLKTVKMVSSTNSEFRMSALKKVSVMATTSNFSVVRRPWDWLWTFMGRDHHSFIPYLLSSTWHRFQFPLNQLHRSFSLYLTHNLSFCVVTSNLPGREIESLSDLAKLDRCLTQLVLQPTRGENILDLLLTNSPGRSLRLKSSVVYLAVTMKLLNYQLSLPNPPWLGKTISLILKRLTLTDSETFSVKSPGTAVS